MTDEKPLTPGEHAAGMTPERKRVGLEATGFRDVEAIEANETTHADAANVIVRSARTFKRALAWRGKVL
jgi:hypothetical protein